MLVSGDHQLCYECGEEESLESTQITSSLSHQTRVLSSYSIPALVLSAFHTHSPLAIIPRVSMMSPISQTRSWALGGASSLPAFGPGLMPHSCPLYPSFAGVTNHPLHKTTADHGTVYQLSAALNRTARVWAWEEGESSVGWSFRGRFPWGRWVGLAPPGRVGFIQMGHGGRGALLSVLTA